MHEPIKRFHLEGEIKDIIKARDKFEPMIEDEMRSQGYVPVMDMFPQLSTTYVAARDSYMFVLSIYGTFVGKDKALKCMGMENGRLIMITPPSKSPPF